VTGLILTKLDGTARGGVVASIAHARSLYSHARSLDSHARTKASGEKPIPVRFIGVGEGLDDLRPFNAGEFVTALFD
jgi:fused signal recognition particle receptor